MLVTKKDFIIPKGTKITEEMMQWMKKNCKEIQETNCDLPEGWNEIFGGFKK